MTTSKMGTRIELSTRDCRLPPPVLAAAAAAAALSMWPRPTLETEQTCRRPKFSYGTWMLVFDFSRKSHVSVLLPRFSFSAAAGK